MSIFDFFKKEIPQRSEMPNETRKSQPEFGDSFGKCGNTAYWEYDVNNNTFLISGEGAIENFENINDYQRRTIYDPHNLGPWFEKPDFSRSSIPGNVPAITIPEGITRIESMTFWRFKNLKTIKLPKSIEQISESAFLHTEEIVFLVFKGSCAEAIVDSLGWNKKYCTN